MKKIFLIALFATLMTSCTQGLNDQQIQTAIMKTQAAYSETPNEGPDLTITSEPSATLTLEVTSSPTMTQTSQPSATFTSGPTETPTEIPQIGSTRENGMDHALMVFVPEGEFTMGLNSKEAYTDEMPEHLVYLDAFWIYETPVTNSQFSKFVEETGYVTDAEKMVYSGVWSIEGSYENQVFGAYWADPIGDGSGLAGIEQHPVVDVSWYDADSYCTWAGGRLPTEAEWEKAARGTDGRLHPWGNGETTAKNANYCDIDCNWYGADSSQDDGYRTTSPVGNYPDGKSPYGALDMVGNVWEWVFDWYVDDYYEESPYLNPQGPLWPLDKVLRGADWSFVGYDQRTTIRLWSDPAIPISNIGFRCVVDIAP